MSRAFRDDPLSMQRGDAGYGWLPYEYVYKGLAEDFWSILKKEWVDTGEFKV